MAKVRILIVEDEVLVARDIEKILKTMQHETVGIVSSGEEAIRIAGEHSPDLVIMDIALKGSMDGVEAAERIRRDFNIPVIYLTALSNEQTLQRAKITEPYGYIFKPFESKELHAAIEMTLYKYKMEEALKQAEEKYRGIFMHAAEGIFQTTPEGHFLSANPSMAQMLGFESPEELMAKRADSGYQRYVHPEQRGEFKRLINEQGFVRRFEYQIYRKDGTKIWLSENVRAVHDSSGKLLYYEGTAEDITARKEVEERIRASETRFRELFNNMRSAVAVYEAVQNGQNFIFKDFNRAGEQIDKIKKGDIIGKSLLEVFPRVKDFGLFKVLQRVWKTGNPEHFPDSFYKDERIAGWRENFVYKLPTGEVVAVYDDVTEKKQAEEKLKKSSEELHRLALHLQLAREQERTHIAHELHDELGQALTALKMDISWILKKLPADERTLAEKTKSTSQLIDKTIKTVQKLSTEMRPGILDDLGLTAAIEWQAEEFQNRTGIHCEFTSTLNDFELDREHATAIFRIFQEALTNIVRHAQATKVEISFEEKENSFALRIKDNGRGISEKEIFSPHSIGLIGMRERAQALGGQIEIKGEKKRGTSVVVLIPLRKKDKENGQDTHR